jgi:hypothetical protein
VRQRNGVVATRAPVTTVLTAAFLAVPLAAAAGAVDIDTGGLEDAVDETVEQVEETVDKVDDTVEQTTDTVKKAVTNGSDTDNPPALPPGDDAGSGDGGGGGAGDSGRATDGDTYRVFRSEMPFRTVRK